MWMKNYVGLEYLEQKEKVHVRRMSPTPRSTHTSISHKKNYYLRNIVHKKHRLTTKTILRIIGIRSTMNLFQTLNLNLKLRW